jgi:predicted phosphodiesterase
LICLFQGDILLAKSFDTLEKAALSTDLKNTYVPYVAVLFFHSSCLQAVFGECDWVVVKSPASQNFASGLITVMEITLTFLHYKLCGKMSKESNMGLYYKSFFVINLLILRKTVSGFKMYQGNGMTL